MTATYLNELGLICALGNDRREVAAALLASESAGMQVQSGWVPGRSLPVGTVKARLANIPEQRHDTRNNRLLLAAATQIVPAIRTAIQRYGAARVAVVLGTSTSGIHESAQGIRHHHLHGQLPEGFHYSHQELCNPAAFLAEHYELAGPAYVISTACTSSGRALQSARRLLNLGLCDAVLCGGVDSLCELTLNGFSALEAVSDERCKPFSANRRGINIGEGAALFLMTREPARVALLGAGASSDAHHISAPEPEGRGAREAMRKALADAKLDAAQIAYLNLHGTATAHNDAMESLAVSAEFPAGVPCSSTKPLSGHTLGAAGALEAAFCWLLLSEHNPHNRLPPQRWDGMADPQLPALQLVGDDAPRLPNEGPRYLMSNSFAFGGNNISLILGEMSEDSGVTR
ncbi:MAG: beta-ketoacyl-[acyl-carrier-protein] synthase II [Pseudomonas sp.]|uniref:beta-ketoacyl-[acyl-carrier-protein] synthase family protein n=1 Tax=Pseudomonas sp. TaxID=306 RepID=UPI000CBC6594|nr:beta-ketoacyl-[acyl-carrier-protein] synthase family protein [Pseudomonas sp.]PJI46557.1 MAG: beta-ketoacyl-[acyl-carrier-protein] synthase II [Pseudomonas sp.]